MEFSYLGRISSLAAGAVFAAVANPRSSICVVLVKEPAIGVQGIVGDLRGLFRQSSAHATHWRVAEKLARWRNAPLHALEEAGFGKPAHNSEDLTRRRQTQRACQLGLAREGLVATPVGPQGGLKVCSIRIRYGHTVRRSRCLSVQASSLCAWYFFIGSCQPTQSPSNAVGT